MGPGFVLGNCTENEVSVKFFNGVCEVGAKVEKPLCWVSNCNFEVVVDKLILYVLGDISVDSSVVMMNFIL
jgi:hypothetical protein